MTIEQRLAFGKQLVFLLTPKGAELGAALRLRDYSVAEIKGHTRDGELTIICVEIARREARKLIHIASVIDENCAVIVHDIRRLDFARHPHPKLMSGKTSAGFGWLTRLGNSFQWERGSEN
jgi:uncharacterized protein YebE (UPF0316 family)